MNEENKSVTTNLSDIEKDFLEKLYSVFKEYGADLGGCGCCGSPSVGITGLFYYNNVCVSTEGISFVATGRDDPKYYRTDIKFNEDGKISSITDLSYD
jgi:hypothetical protein